MNNLFKKGHMGVGYIFHSDDMVCKTLNSSTKRLKISGGLIELPNLFDDVLEVVRIN